METVTERLVSRLQLIGDDIFVTNPARLKKGIEGGVGNAVLVKMNQIGTLTETRSGRRWRSAHGYRTVVARAPARPKTIPWPTSP